MGIFDNMSYKDAMELRNFMQQTQPAAMAAPPQQLPQREYYREDAERHQPQSLR